VERVGERRECGVGSRRRSGLGMKEWWGARWVEEEGIGEEKGGLRGDKMWCVREIM